jgi:hypothetical protein
VQGISDGGGTGGDRGAVVRHSVGRNGDARWCARIVAATEGGGIGDGVAAGPPQGPRCDQGFHQGRAGQG